jgi:hypothetical protein
MPRSRGRLYCDEGLLGGLIGVGHQGIETSTAGASKQDSLSCLVLDQKEERMKLNKDVIVKGKSMN